MCLLCRLPVAKNHNSGQILNFWGLLYRLPFIDEGQIWCPDADRTSTLMCLISPESVHFVVFQCPKTTILGKFWLLGGSCTDPLPPMRAISGVLQLTHSRRLRVKICLDRFILSPSGGEKLKSLPFFGLRHLVMSTVGGNLSKLNTGAQLQTFPYPTASKLFLYSNIFMVKSGAQTLTFKSVTSQAWQKKRDWQTKKLNVFHRPDGGWNPIATKLGMVIEDLEHVVSPLKRLGVRRIVSPLGGTENLGVTRPCQIKTPITP